MQPLFDTSVFKAFKNWLACHSVHTHQYKNFNVGPK